MKTKWEWIANILEKKGMDETAKQAMVLNAHLLEVCKNKHTEDWRKDYKDLPRRLEDRGKRWFRETLIPNSNYCVACVESESSCPGCIFGREYGYCGDQDSDLGRFWEAWDHEEKYWREVEKYVHIRK